MIPREAQPALTRSTDYPIPPELPPKFPDGYMTPQAYMSSQGRLLQGCFLPAPLMALVYLQRFRVLLHRRFQAVPVLLLPEPAQQPQVLFPQKQPRQLQAPLLPELIQEPMYLSPRKHPQRIRVPSLPGSARRFPLCSAQKRSLLISALLIQRPHQHPVSSLFQGPLTHCPLRYPRRTVC